MSKKQSASPIYLPTMFFLIFVLLVLAVMVAGFLPWSLPVVRQQVNGLLKKIPVQSITVEGVSIRPWSALELRQLSLTTPLGQDTTIELHIKRLRIDYSIVKILGSFSQARTLLSRAQKEGFGVVLNEPTLGAICQAIALHQAEGTIRVKNTTIARLSGGKAKVGIISDPALLIEGTVEAESLVVSGKYPFENLKGKARLEKNELQLSGIEAELFEGDLELDLAANLATKRLHDLTARCSKVNLEQLYRSQPKNPGSISGTATVDLVLNASAIHPDSLEGKASLTVKSIVAHQLPIQKNLLVMIALPDLDTLRFDKITTDITIDKGKLHTHPLHGSGTPISFTSEGYIGIDGYFFQDVKALLSSDYVKQLAPIIRESLLPESGNRRSFKCIVKGTFDNPRVVHDKVIMQRAANNAFKELKKSFKKFFR
jgi:hypothetical protein